MNEQLNYISDAELEQLILQVEQEELVAAPPDLLERIIDAAIPEKPMVIQKKEFYAYCFRVMTSVAAAIALVFLLPELLGRMEQVGTPLPGPYEKSAVVQAAPSYEEIVEKVPDREEVVASKPTPTKAEVLNNTGFFEKVISSTAGWFGKESDK